MSGPAPPSPTSRLIARGVVVRAVGLTVVFGEVVPEDGDGCLSLFALLKSHGRTPRPALQTLPHPLFWSRGLAVLWSLGPSG